MLRIGIAQLDPVVGSFESNVEKISSAYQRACQQQARLLLTSELSTCGYPLLDLLDRPEIFEKSEKALEALAQLTQGKSTALVVGHIARAPSGKAQNCVSVLENGKVVFSQAKTLLPTYDVFDEARYFEPASGVHLWNLDGLPVALAVCEDLWAAENVGYTHDPVTEYERSGARLVLGIAASPYHQGKRQVREKLHGKVASRLKAPLVYLNQFGATDELIFDGSSFVLDSEGKCVKRLPSFQESVEFAELSESGVWQGLSQATLSNEPEIRLVGKALILGVRDYFKRTGFKKAVLGLSGGIDSAVVATLAVQALGAENVRGIAMPSQYSSSHSLADAENLARNLGIPFEVKPIKFQFATALREISEGRGTLASLAQENLQARLRGLILMTLSNHESALVLTTGNKSEMAMGYCTLYGDMVGALAPIGDLYKTQVYELARDLNLCFSSPIPESTLTKAPSAELRPHQTDQDSLPPYEVLDQILVDALEHHLPVAEIEAKWKGQNYPQLKSIRELLRKVDLNEYKRRQAAPILKVSARAFGIGRRVPLAKSWGF